MSVSARDIALDPMVNAVELVHERLLRSTRALASARVPYAVAGGNAVAAWVSTLDPDAVRNTADVDILIRRTDLPAGRTALETAGFVYPHVGGVDVLLDGHDGRLRSGIHVIFAGEKVREHELLTKPRRGRRPRDRRVPRALARGVGPHHAHRVSRQGPNPSPRHARRGPHRRGLGRLLSAGTGPTPPTADRHARRLTAPLSCPA